MKNFYEILGVPQTATQEEIKKSYRTKSKELHPDVNPEGEEKFKELNEAYQTLSDERKRGEYDAMRDGGGFSDFMNNFMNNFMRGASPAPSHLVSILNVGVCDLMKGVTVDFNYERRKMCGGCGGAGGKTAICGACAGSGVIRKEMGNNFINRIYQTVCTKCAGTGKVVIDPCKECLGEGSIKEEVKMKVKLNREMTTGSVIPKPGMGNFDHGGQGDLLIKLNIEEQNDFSLARGGILIHKRFFAMEELEKDEFVVKHPDGDFNVPMPLEFNTSIPIQVPRKGLYGNPLFIKYEVRFKNVKKS